MPRTRFRPPAPTTSSTRQAKLAMSMALVLSLVGVALLAVMLRDRPAPAGVVVGGLSLRIQEAGWVQMDHVEGGSGGFQMPAAMMPGAPLPGEERLRLQVTLANTTDSPRRLSDGEFRLQSADGDTWPLRSETFGLDQLGPGLAVSGSLHFDVRSEGARLGDGSLQLVWERAGKVVRLAVPAGAAPDHGDGH